MSNDQIQQILAALKAQNDADKIYRDEQEKLNHEHTKRMDDMANAYGKHAQFVQNKLDAVTSQVTKIADDVAPVVKLSQNIEGFDNVTKAFLKFTLAVAALISAIGVILLSIRRIITGHFL